MKKFAKTLLTGTLLFTPVTALEGNTHAERLTKEEVVMEVESGLEITFPPVNQLTYQLDESFLESVMEEIKQGESIVEAVEVNEEKYSAFYIVNTPLNKRKTPNLDFEPIGYLSKGEPVEGKKVLRNGWVQLSDGSYVNGKYLNEKPGMTPEQYDDRVAKFKAEQAALLAERKKQAAIAAQKAAEQKRVAQTTSTQQKVKTTTQQVKSTGRNGISISASDRELLARLVRAEAGGESYEGMVAVAAVVFNRMASSQFASTVEGVVYAKNQFSPVANGSIKKPASDIHFKAVDDALTRDNTNGALFFYAPSLVKSPYMESLRTVAVIGVHHFKVN